MADRTETTESTRDQEETEARSDHAADRAPTEAEEAAAERGAEIPQTDAGDVAAHEKEMGELGANVKGEGEIE
jgi:hypothetical protein